jgi:WD40 repeat protein
MKRARRAVLALAVIVLSLPTAAATPPVRVDAYGDELPAGAVGRLGTTRYRQYGREFVGFSADGKALLFLGPNSLHWADLATGKTTRVVPAPDLSSPGAQLIQATLAAKAPVLAVLQHNGNIALVDANTGKVREQSGGEFPSGVSLLLSPDSKRLIVIGGGSAKGPALVVIDTASRKVVHEFPWLAGRNLFFAGLSADGKQLTAVEDGKDGRLLVWDLTTGKLLHSVTWPQREPSGRVQLLPDGKTVLIGHHIGDTVYLVDLAGGKTIRSFRDDDLEQSSEFVAGDDGRMLYAACAGKIQEWDIASGKPGRAFRSGLLSANGRLRVTLAPGGKHLVGLARTTWAAWDLATGKELSAPTGHSGPLGAVAFSPDGKKLVSAGADYTTRLWDVATGKETHRLQAPLDVAKPRGDWLVELVGRKAAFSGDGKVVVSTGLDRRAHAWDAATGKDLSDFGDEYGERDFTFLGQPLAFAPKGQTLALLDAELLRLYHAGSGKELRKWAWGGPADTILPPLSAAALAWSPDGRLLAVPRHNGRNGDVAIDLWEMATGKKRATLVVDAVALTGWKTVEKMYPFNAAPTASGPTPSVGLPVVALAFSPDGKRLAVADLVAVHLFDLATGKEIHTFGGRQVFGGSVAFSPDGKLLAAGCHDGAIRLWNAASGAVLRDVPGHELTVSRLAFSPDGKLLASASADTTVLLWDVEEIARPGKW